MTKLFLFALTTLISITTFAQVEITDNQRYLDLSTLTLNEPCLEFNGTQFMGQFVLDQSGGYTWKILSGEELTETRTGCTILTAGSGENDVFFNLSNLVIADGNTDTGQRYDIDSVADATRLDLGFAVTNAVASAPGSAQEMPSENNETPSQNDSLPTVDFDLLFIGNSHSRFNDFPNLVKTLIETGVSGKSVNAQAAPASGFLDEHLANGSTKELVESKAWTHVILQAQKYSSSGRYSYPTTAAENWIRIIRSINAAPLLFPEWPRRGNFEEGQRVYELHLQIASQEPACVAPIGLVWDEVIATYPGLVLHAPDGNHSNLAGALLTAYIFYQVITDKPASGLPYIAQINISADVQKQLRDTASTITKQYPCPK